MLPLLLAPPPALAQTRVLFVGNSHTFVNDLPGLFAGLAQAAGQPVTADESAFGGYTWEQHAANGATLAKIAKGGWDHVFLQEHSLYPSIDVLWETSSVPAARQLDSLIAASASGTGFFMTWGWELGGSHCVGDDCSPDFPDYFAMQHAVTEAYVALSTELDAFLVPAGSVWARALAVDPASPLWAADHYHPSLEGSYLTACVFFARVFDESPEGLDFYGGIDPARALFYQGIAAEVLADAPEFPPKEASRLVNYPNPFNPRTRFEFVLDEGADAVLTILDAGGRLVDRYDLGRLPAGRHRCDWDAGGSPSGVYVASLSAGGCRERRKIALLR